MLWFVYPTIFCRVPVRIFAIENVDFLEDTPTRNALCMVRP